MEWKIYKNGEFLCEANCQYDSLDLATMMYGAVEIKVNFDKKIAEIIK